jgi:hypothetical protein
LVLELLNNKRLFNTDIFRPSISLFLNPIIIPRYV